MVTPGGIPLGMFGFASSPSLALCFTRVLAVGSGVIFLRATLEGPCEVFLRAFLGSEPTMALIIGRTEQSYLEDLFCLLPPPSLFPFDLSLRTDRCFLQQDPRGCR